jgi:hypothetical protein
MLLNCRVCNFHCEIDGGTIDQTGFTISGNQMPEKDTPFIFVCSVSEDLYGASPNANGEPLPTPGGGKWLPVDGLAAIGDASVGFDEIIAEKDIAQWGCHWFTSHGPRDINWGPDGPPQ